MPHSVLCRCATDVRFISPIQHIVPYRSQTGSMQGNLSLQAKSFQFTYPLHRVPKKLGHFIIALSLVSDDRFEEYFHNYNQK